MDKLAGAAFLVLLLTVTTGNGLICEERQYPGMDPQTGKEICVCELGSYMKDGHCYYCTSAPQDGSREEVKRPCTSVSNTEIGCVAGTYRKVETVGYVCMSCTLCMEGEDETASCTEYHDRKCTPRPSTKRTTDVVPVVVNNCSCPTQPTCPTQTTSSSNIKIQTTKADGNGHYDEPIYYYLYIAFLILAPVVVTVSLVFLVLYILHRRKQGSMAPVPSSNKAPKKDTVHPDEFKTLRACNYSRESGIETDFATSTSKV